MTVEFWYSIVPGLIRNELQRTARAVWVSARCGGGALRGDGRCSPRLAQATAASAAVAAAPAAPAAPAVLDAQPFLFRAGLQGFEAEAAELMRRLPERERAHLRVAALCLVRAQRVHGTPLPAPLVGRILAQAADLNKEF